MKHVQVRDLALQQWIADGRLTLQKVASSANAADLLTKHITECTPVPRPETWSSTVTARQRLLKCCIGMWTDGRNGAPVYWLDFVTIGMRLLSAMCSVRHERSAFLAYRGVCCW